MNRQKTRHSLFCHILFFSCLFFSCLEKQNKTSLQMIQYYQSTFCLCTNQSLVFQYSWEYANEGASHSIVKRVMWPKQRGLRARGVRRLQSHRIQGGKPHLSPSAVRAIHCLHNGNWPMFLFLIFLFNVTFHKLKHSNTLLTHLPAS